MTPSRLRRLARSEGPLAHLETRAYDTFLRSLLQDTGFPGGLDKQLAAGLRAAPFRGTDTRKASCSLKGGVGAGPAFKQQAAGLHGRRHQVGDIAQLDGDGSLPVAEDHGSRERAVSAVVAVLSHANPEATRCDRSSWAFTHVGGVPERNG